MNLLSIFGMKLLIVPGNFVDCLHMNEKGNAKILVGVKDTITTKLTLPSSIIPGLLNGQYPSWLEVAGKSIEETEAIINAWVCKKNDSLVLITIFVFVL